MSIEHNYRELFYIRKWRRRFDRRTGKFVINISYETAAPEPTDRVVGVAEAFGLAWTSGKSLLYMIMLS